MYRVSNFGNETLKTENKYSFNVISIYYYPPTEVKMHLFNI